MKIFFRISVVISARVTPQISPEVSGISKVFLELFCQRLPLYFFQSLTGISPEIYPEVTSESLGIFFALSGVDFPKIHCKAPLDFFNISSERFHPAVSPKCHPHYTSGFLQQFYRGFSQKLLLGIGALPKIFPEISSDISHNKHNKQ